MWVLRIQVMFSCLSSNRWLADWANNLTPCGKYVCVCIYVIWVYIYVCVCVHVYLRMCVYECTHMRMCTLTYTCEFPCIWRPGVDVGHLHCQPCSILVFLRQVFSLNVRLTNLVRLGDEQASGNPLSLLLCLSSSSTFGVHYTFKTYRW